MRRRSERVVATTGIIFLCIMEIIGIPVSLVENTDSFGTTVGISLFFPVVLWFIGGIRAAKTVVFEGGVMVQNWFTRYWVPWSAVAEVDAEPGVSVQLTDGSELILAVGGGSLLNQLRGNRYQHSVREQIEEVFERADDAGTGDAAAVQREWVFGVKRLVVWLAVFLGTLGLTLGGMALAS